MGKENSRPYAFAYGRGFTRRKNLQKSSCFDVEGPSLCGEFFNAGVVRGSVENIIVAKVQRHVADSFDARVVLPLLVGEENAIPTL